MLFLLSPAKSLDFETPANVAEHTKPLFVPQATELIALLQQKSPQQIASLMSLSDALAQQNLVRYQAWRPRFTAHNSKQAVLAFDGAVYRGLDAASLTPAELAWLQGHVCLLSGLYGVLRPLDWMQPYRLEMGTALENAQGRNLYQFWGSRISEYLNQRLRAEVTPLVVNLASQEYFKAVDLKALKARVIECVFQEYRAGKYGVNAFYAKRARGLMTRYAVTQHVATPEGLKGFDVEGYAFDAAASTLERFIFRRKQQ